MRRALLPILAVAALAATAVAAPAAKAPSRKARASAVAFVVQVVRPSGDAITLGSQRTRGGSAKSGGAFAYPGDGSAVRVAAARTSVDASAGGLAGVGAHHRHRRRGVAARRAGHGLVAARRRRRPRPNSGRARSQVRAHVTGLRVGGVAIYAATNDVIDLPGIGTLTVGETVEAIRSPGGSRDFTVALHLRLSRQAAGLPAGSEILVGYAEGGAAAPKPAPKPQVAGVSATNLAGSSVPAVPVAPTPTETGNAGGRNTTNTEDPPPGGFTRTPPIRPETKAELLGGGYMFPVVGGAQFSDDFGGPRAETGFHQGIDLFSANGTPRRRGARRHAVPGRLEPSRRLAPLARRRPGQLLLLRAPVRLQRSRARRRARARGRRDRLHGRHRRRAGHAVPPPLRDPPRRRLGGSADRLRDGVGVGHAGRRQRRGVDRPAARGHAGRHPGRRAVLDEQSDISSVSGLDDAALAQAVGAGAEGAGPAAQPDAIVAVGSDSAPGFVGLTG